MPVMPYREGGGAGFVCKRCGETTPPNPHIPADEARLPDETFVCVECLLRMQEMASRGRESLWVHTPLGAGGRLVTGGEIALFVGGTAVAFGSLALAFTGRLFILALAISLAGLAYAWKIADPVARHTALVRRGSLALLAIAISAQGIVMLTPARKAKLEPPPEPVLIITNDAPAPRPAPVAPLEPEPETARRELGQRAFNAYAAGLEAGEPTLPKGFPTVWKLVKAIPVSPFNGGIWITDDTLTDTHVLVEGDRLRLGGKSTRQGKAATCAGVVEVVADEPAVFVTSCADETGAASYRVLRVSLPELPALLQGAPPSNATIPPAQRGVFRTGSNDCRTAQTKLIVTASTILEDEGSSLVAVLTNSSGLGSILEGVRVGDARACTGLLDKWDGHPRLTTTCVTPRRQVLCPR